jgi:hypothetical protein
MAPPWTVRLAAVTLALTVVAAGAWRRETQGTSFPKSGAPQGGAPAALAL